MTSSTPSHPLPWLSSIIISTSIANASLSADPNTHLNIHRVACQHRSTSKLHTTYSIPLHFFPPLVTALNTSFVLDSILGHGRAKQILNHLNFGNMSTSLQHPSFFFSHLYSSSKLLHLYSPLLIFLCLTDNLKTVLRSEGMYTHKSFTT